jgi:carbonic anhydrase
METGRLSVRGLYTSSADNDATDKRHSATARMKFAGHVDQRTFGKSYAHPLSDVDGPATFLGIASRHEHIQNRRSMGMHRHPHLWQSLPAKAEFEFQERDDVQAIDDEMQQLGARLDGLTDDSEKHEIRVQQHRLYNKKQKLYMEELKRLRQTQPRNCTSQPSSVYEQTFFHYTRRVMPERDLLAQVLPKIGNLRSPTGRAALKALEAICSGNGLTPYRSGIRPLHGKCLCGEVVETCVISLAFPPCAKICLGINPIVGGPISIAAMVSACAKWVVLTLLSTASSVIAGSKVLQNGMHTVKVI